MAVFKKHAPSTITKLHFRTFKEAAPFRLVFDNNFTNIVCRISRQIEAAVTIIHEHNKEDSMPHNKHLVKRVDWLTTFRCKIDHVLAFELNIW